MAIISLKDNPERAVTFTQEPRVRCRKLASFPEAAPARPDYGDGVRAAVFGRYLILYVVHPDVLEIHSVVHGAREIKPADALG